ncbi:hypothetical protein D3C79_1075400 [compost metagenome]
MALPIVMPLIGMMYWGVGSIMSRPSKRPIMSNSVAAMAMTTLHQIPASPLPRLAALLAATVIMNMTIAMMNNG